jgi:tripartite-type tricarboxylate transporter receptor subunit TctC
MKNLSFALYAVMSIGAWSGVAVAADWPTGPVTIIVPYTPGNITDIAARVLAQKLSDRTGKSFIVENKPGASTQIGTDLVARARGDAHTLLLTGAVFATNPALFSKLPYDSAKDIAPVGLVVSNPLVFVTAEQKPFADFSSFVTYAKSNPGAASVASGGSGTLSHMAMALMAITTDTNVVHVPYKGGSAAAIDTLTGQVDGMWDNPSSAIPQISAGRIRALAVSGIERNPALASVPTVAEQGYKDFEVINWFGLFAPATVPPQLLDAIHDQVQAVLEAPEVKERFAKDGVTAGGPSRAEFAAFVADETKRWGAIIEKNNIRAD